MSNLTKKLLGLPPETPSAAKGPSLSVETSPLAAAPNADFPDASWTGLRDAVESGWFLNDTNEIFRGVPIGPDDHVVDVGCGDGGSSLFCARRGARVTSIDIDPGVVAAIESKLMELLPGRYAAMVSDAAPLPLEDAIASRVICTEVLEHVDDPEQVLAELFRIGKPGALYLLTVPDALQENLQQHVAPPSYFQKPNHVRIIERNQFAEMVTRTGLVIDEHTYYGFFWSIWWAMFWACDVDLNRPNHPALGHWTAAWSAILDMPGGQKLKQQLDSFMPKSQIIVAHKP